MPAIKDIYMNFFSCEVTAGVNAMTFTGANHNTAAGAMSGRAWRIHLLEWAPAQAFAASATLTLALSTRKGLTTMPSPNDKGLLGLLNLTCIGVTGQMIKSPMQDIYLPPMIIAAPNISMYCDCDTDDVTKR